MKENNITNEDLARMVGQGFLEVNEKLERMQEKNEKRFSGLEQGQQDIKLRLNEHAFQMDVCDLQKCVTILERKAQS